MSEFIIFLYTLGTLEKKKYWYYPGYPAIKQPSFSDPLYYTPMGPVSKNARVT